MTAFQQLRLWARRAPIAERIAALLGASLAVAVLAWLIVPATNHHSSNPNVATGGFNSGSGSQSSVASGSSGAASQSSANGSSGGSTGASGATAGSTGAAGGSSGATGGSSGSQPAANKPGTGGPQASSSGGCASPPGSDQGVNSSSIKVAIILIQIVGPAANSTFGIPPPSDQQADFQDVVNSINASGGVACRKLVPVFYIGDPADQAGLEQLCQNIISAGPFFVLDGGAYYTFPAIATCYPQNHIPYVVTGGLTASQQGQFYPYDYGLFLLDELFKDTVFALQQRGFFSPSSGFKKLGILYRDCTPQLEKEEVGWLNQAGISSSEIVAHDVGCPSSYDSPSDLEAAILTFKQDGVTNVTVVDDTGDFANFTTIAQQQKFNPKYGFGDEGLVAIAYGSQEPNYQNIANALAITTYRYGEEHTPGYPLSAGTQKCNAIFAANSQPPVYQQPIGEGGIACDLLWFVQAATDHAPALERSALAAGLQNAGSVDFSYPYGPNNFTAGHVTTAGQFWRTDQFLESCSCYRVVDATFHNGF